MDEHFITKAKDVCFSQAKVRQSLYSNTVSMLKTHITRFASVIMKSLLSHVLHDTLQDTISP